MKYASFALACLAAFMFLADECLAHKVSVFAFVDGDEIQVECGFSRNQKVKNGKLVVADLETGETVLEGTTDTRGVFRFRPSDEFLATGHGLSIQLFAGEGHRDDWRMSPEELRALSPAGRSGMAARAERSDTTQPGRTAVSEEKAAMPLSAVDTAELEAIIGRVVDEKLAPVRQALARRRESEPGLRDIVGGIGWILGLLGLAAYMKYRRT